jgi:KTSC domain
MKRKNVSSSMMASIGYDEKTKTLEIEFNSGTIWQYFDVPKSEFNKMTKADSLGRYFRDCIKDCYEEARVR